MEHSAIPEFTLLRNDNGEILDLLFESSYLGEFLQWRLIGGTPVVLELTIRPNVWMTQLRLYGRLRTVAARTPPLVTLKKAHISTPDHAESAVDVWLRFQDAE